MKTSKSEVCYNVSGDFLYRTGADFDAKRYRFKYELSKQKRPPWQLISDLSLANSSSVEVPGEVPS